MPEYLFYFSYAQQDQDAYLERFQSDLSQEVRMMTGTREPVFFFDRDSLPRDADWPQAIAEALFTSRVLVALLSPAYFAAQLCGKEWQFFQERQHRPTPFKSAILPVQWVVGTQSRPQAITETQTVEIEFPERYNQEGLRYLMQLRRFEKDYRNFMRAFSRRLVEAVKDSPLRIGHPPVFNQIPNAFAAPRRPTPPAVGIKGPSVASCVFVVGPEQLEDIRLRAQVVCVQQSLLFREVEVDADLVAHIHDSERAHNLLVLIIDPIAVGVHRRVMEQYSRSSFRNTAAVVLWNEKTAADPALRRVVGEVFAGSEVRHVHSIEELDRELRRALNELRIRIIRDAGAERSLDSLPDVALPRIGGSGDR
jgi:hypothetical protein